MQRICPYPLQWQDVFEQLIEFAEAHPCHPDRPPIPLILAGWAYSNDCQKMGRWRETVDWAHANGCARIVEGISDDDFYEVAQPTNYSVGPLGGPCYREWDFETKARPPKEELSKHLECLIVHWTDVAGATLAAVTQPVAFTGKKARRLLVRAKMSAPPPWGGWTHRSQDEAKRRTFTRFRSAINKIIAPHEVDHIEFVADKK